MRCSHRFVIEDGFNLRALYTGKPLEKLID